MDEISWEQLKSEIATLRQLLDVQEAAALEQARRADCALEAMHKAAKARDQQAQLVDEIIGASSDAVVVLDEVWVICYMNAQARDILSNGVDLVGQNIRDVFPSMIDSDFWAHYEHAMRDRQVVVFEDFHPRLQIWMAVNVSPVGRGIAIFFRDVTERRRRDAAIQKTEKLAVVGRLASSISHEINNPLESVVNLLYLIENSANTSTEMARYAALATSELSRVSHIVTQTLKFHRQSTSAAECRMSEILEGVVSLFQGRIATRNIHLHRSYANNDKVVCFAGDMRQVFANLIGNALDATNINGRIWLRTHPSRDWRTGRPGLRILVIDDGCGMSEATRDNLFEPFFTTKPTTGTGLGLWVSEEIVRNHQGTITVRSSEQPGRSGTIFSVFLPVAD
jgi:signal transduction histidine kinase